MKRILIKIVKIYQVLISPFLGRRCRFYPSCSEYCCLALEKYGAKKGVLLTLKRIAKCNPWGGGGVDNP